MQVGGRESAGNAPKVVIGPGTGLSVSGLVPSKAGWVPLSGGGGYVSFLPSDDTEVMTWQYAKKKYGHASAGRFLSGSGPILIYKALAVKKGLKLKKLTPAKTSKNAPSGSSPLYRLTLDMSCVMLDTVASNLALALGVNDGVYLCGSIIPRFIGYFRFSPFHNRLENKGRLDACLASIPVYVVLSRSPGLIGSTTALDNHL